ncbi:MAG: MazG nucleotide pyrophosphohydrolase domain-containing protein [Patescibacteria group bacterium]|nr:MazG nucleotide pyrophosphohydrolase domain-containing protein [Patescibacteria group bacterium]
MATLKNRPTLSDLQKYVAEAETERRHDKESIIKKFAMLVEEVGELFVADRKKPQLIKPDHNPEFASLDEELADILTYLCSIANHLGVNMEKAFRNKEEINEKRMRK